MGELYGMGITSQQGYQNITQHHIHYNHFIYYETRVIDATNVNSIS